MSNHLWGKENSIGGLNIHQGMGKVKKDFQKTELKLEKRSCGNQRRRQVFKERDKNGWSVELIEKAWESQYRAREEEGLRNPKRDGKWISVEKEELKETKKMGAKKRNPLHPRRCQSLGKPRDHAETFVPWFIFGSGFLQEVLPLLHP